MTLISSLDVRLKPLGVFILFVFRAVRSAGLKPVRELSASNRRCGFSLAAAAAEGAGIGTRVFLKSVFAKTNIFFSVAGEGYGRIYSARRESKRTQQKSSGNNAGGACVCGAYGTYYKTKSADLYRKDQQVGAISGKYLVLFISESDVAWNITTLQCS